MKCYGARGKEVTFLKQQMPINASFIPLNLHIASVRLVLGALPLRMDGLIQRGVVSYLRSQRTEMVPAQTHPALSHQLDWFPSVTGGHNHLRSLETMWIPGLHTSEPDLWGPGVYILELAQVPLPSWSTGPSLGRTAASSGTPRVVNRRVSSARKAWVPPGVLSFSFSFHV